MLRTSCVEKILEGSYVRLTLKDMEKIASALNTPLYTLLDPSEMTIEPKTIE